MNQKIKTRPILFSAPMVRALLDGSKTQTRRIVKPQPTGVIAQPGAGKAPSWAIVNRPPATGVCLNSAGNEDWLSCPYGYPGDRLWVRETWRHTASSLEEARAITEDIASGTAVDWRATYIERCIKELGFSREDAEVADSFERWRPSIHMPRWASRILLEIVSVRVERLQDISEADARAEGCPCYVCGRLMDGRSEDDCHCFHRQADASDYRNLWESINGAGSWDANPWIWALEFKRLTPLSAP